MKETCSPLIRSIICLHRPPSDNNSYVMFVRQLYDSEPSILGTSYSIADAVVSNRRVFLLYSTAAIDPR